jgi:hypothetical protein
MQFNIVRLAKENIMKNYLIGFYIVVAVLFSFYLKGCSATADRSYMYNLGKAIVWPISMFN